ncbi:TadE/TadG family type IV pilus assembly protein [Paenibacillus sp. HW567]|uniref:TadE/TadG family type IV pilus assembly protein n=1 Tax=Paenibacillus sp. HW567 TaxID=1034769 RepID=UPI00036EDC69|nr:TadE/TadG family type IV pilus assembly protein [Paenibacillus sp. HW567]
MGNRYRKRKKAKDEGSMVVEAAMVLPMFLLFVLFLIFIVQMTLYSTALQSTASDTVKVISTHMYPAALAAQKWGAKGDGGDDGKAAPGGMGDGTAAGTSGIAGSGGSGGNKDTEAAGGAGPGSGSWSIPRLSIEQWSESYVADLPKPLDEWVKSAVQKGEAPLQKLQAEASQSALDLALKPVMKPYLASDWLQYDRIHVSNVMIPELKEGSRPYFGLVVSYELPMKVPFLNQSIVLEASAVERLWIGNTNATGNEGGDGGAQEENSSIVILEKPNPGVANHQGRIRVKIPPNASANLSIFYKSGQSTAKYLGWKQADANGYIEWEWKIGVNTTPGSWPFVIRLDDGTTLEATFTVVK